MPSKTFGGYRTFLSCLYWDSTIGRTGIERQFSFNLETLFHVNSEIYV